MTVPGFASLPRKVLSPFRWLFLLMLALTLAGCGGIPLSSMPRLMRLSGELMVLDPAELMLAIEVDARMVPPPGGTPLLVIAFKPAQAGAVEAFERKLPMRYASEAGVSRGLNAPGKGRRWLIYSLTPESQTELVQLRERFKQQRAQAEGKRGGTLSLGIEQEGVAVRDPAFADTRWESWLQTSRREGFYELWTGSVADLLRQAERARAQKSS